MKHIILVLFFITLAVTSYTQNTGEVKNLDLDIIDNNIIVNYDLITKKPAHVGLFFLDQSYKVVSPTTLKGDVGENITGGTNKQIIWNISEDRAELSRKLHPKIILKNTNHRLGGPSNVLLSLFVPGLGDYFVKNPKNMTFKPYMRTIAAWGFVGLGLKALDERYDKQLIAEGYDYDIINRDPGYYYTEGVYGVETQYWLFDYDAEIFLALGGLVWIGDMIWVAAEGSANKKIRHLYSNTSVIPNRYGGFNLSYTFEF